MATDYDAPKITDSDEPGHLPRTAHRQRKGTQPPTADVKDTDTADAFELPRR
ncbi:DUF4193 family protein [Rhodococcus opacus]|nr:DUF4193 family protein [Rhodococcus opacus]